MAKPRYMLCSESRIVDRLTGLITYCNVLDQLTISVGGTTPANSMSFLKFVVSAVWARESDEEAEAIYEFETYLHLPGQTKPRCIHAGQFQFGKAQFQRLEVLFQGPVIAAGTTPPPDAMQLTAGSLRLESRIRPSGGGEWLSQEYSISICVERQASKLAESSQSNNAE